MNIFLSILCAWVFVALLIFAYLAIRDWIADISRSINAAFPSAQRPWANFWLRMLVMVVWLLIFVVGAIEHVSIGCDVATWIYRR